MGIAIDYFEYFAAMIKDNDVPLRSCLQLGRQRICFNYETLLGTAIRHGFLPLKSGKCIVPPAHPLASVIDQDRVLTSDPSRQLLGHVTDIAAFSALGFERVDSLDLSNSEGASVIWDLNETGLQDALAEPYDVIVDGGTLEHVFHVPNALANIAASLAIGGYVFHIVPMNNYVDHGFYQFSPTLFFDYYSANHFEIVEARIFASEPAGGGMAFSRRYLRNANTLAEFPYVGSLGKQLFDFSFIARKTRSSEVGRIPEQFIYCGTDLSRHTTIASAERVIVWGAGTAAQTILGPRFDHNRIAYFVDRDEHKQEQTCLGRPVRDPRALQDERDCVVLISSAKFENTIRLEISQLFGPFVGRIVTLNELLADSDAQRPAGNREALAG